MATIFFVTTLTSAAAADDPSICYAHVSQPDAAIAACSRLINSKKVTGLKLGDTYSWRGHHRNATNEFDLAIADFNQAIELKRANAVVYLERSTAWIGKGDFDRAIADADRGIRLDPKSPSSFAIRGAAWHRKGNFDRAISDFTQALSLDPNSSTVYAGRGVIWATKGDYDRAFTDADQAIRLDPKSWGAFNTRGMIWQNKGDTSRALADFEQAIRLNPKSADGYNNRAVVWQAKGDFDRAIADFDQALRLDPKSVKGYNNRGNIWREKGDFDQAIADYDHAIQLDQKAPSPYSNRGLVWRAKGDLDRAVTDFEQALRLDPDYADAYANRGLVYEAKGDLSRAERDFKSAITAPAKYAFSKRYQETAKARLALLTVTDQPVKQISTTAPAGPPGRRIALIIGNGAYADTSALPNPPNDARAVAKNLREIGFEVSEGIDLNRESMKRQVSDFVRNSANAKIALLFYAGHGMQIDGKNYLLPVDAKPADTKDLAAEMTDVDTILAGLDDQIRTNIIILDACRDNPLIQKVALASASRSVSVRSGLAAPSGLGKGATVGAGTLLAFATAPGQVALDGDGSNSPFSAALTRHIGTPGLEVQSMLTRVRADVVATTKNKQVPWSNSSLLGEVFLVEQKP